MIVGRVVGEVWATRKHAKLVGYKLLVVRPAWWYEPAHRVGHLVAIDTDVDAGVGDDVVICLGEPARWKSGGVAMPVDAAVMAVVSRCEIDRAAFAGPRGLTRAGAPRSLIVGDAATPGGDGGGA
jgi:ethanolamine utilization protein EutN